MPYDDLFTFFRWVLSWIVTVYATVITLQSAPAPSDSQKKEKAE